MSGYQLDVTEGKEGLNVYSWLLQASVSWLQHTSELRNDLTGGQEWKNTLYVTVQHMRQLKSTKLSFSFSENGFIHPESVYL